MQTETTIMKDFGQLSKKKDSYVSVKYTNTKTALHTS